MTADLDLRAVDEATDRTDRDLDDGWLGEPDNGWEESAYAEWDAVDADRSVVTW